MGKTSLSKTVDLSKKLKTLTLDVLNRMQDLVDDGGEVSYKDLKDTLFCLLDRSGGMKPGSEISEASRGAVLGALQGLATLSGTTFDEASFLETTAKQENTK